MGVEGGLQFISNADFSSILGARLQVNQQGFDGTALMAKCPGCYNRFNHEQEGLMMGPSHALGCRGEGALSIGRHNKERNLVVEMIQKHLLLIEVETIIEKTLTAQHGVRAAGKGWMWW